MNREFVINIIFLVAINVLIKPIYLFGIDRTVQNTVDTGTYGLYFALFNFTFLFQIVNDFGIRHYNNRSIAQHRQLLHRFFPNILILKAGLGLLYFTLVITAAWLAGYRLPVFPLLLILAFNQLLVSLNHFLRSNLSGLALYRTDSLISVLDRLLLIFICGVMLWYPPLRSRFRIEWFVIAQSVSLLVTALTAFLVIQRRLGVIRFRWSPGTLRLILRRSAPYALVVFFMAVYTRIDGVMIERMLPDGAVEADLYASAFRLLDASNMLGVLFAGLLFPMFARLIAERQPVGPLLRLSFQAIWVASVTAATATYFFRELIMVTLYVDGSAYSGQILGLLMFSFIPMSGAYIYGTLLGAKGELGTMNLIGLAGVVLNIALNLWLIPLYKAAGAALTTGFTQLAVWLAQVVLARRLLQLQNAPGMIARLLFFFTAALFSGYVSAHLIPGPWFLKFLGCIVFDLILAFVFQLLNYQYLIKLLVSEKTSPASQ